MTPRKRPRAGRRLARQWAGIGLMFVALGCLLVPVETLGEAVLRGLVVLACAAGTIALEAE